MVQLHHDYSENDPIVIISVSRGSVHPSTQSALDNSFLPSYTDRTTLNEHLFSEDDLDTLLNDVREHKTRIANSVEVIDDLQRMVQILTEAKGAYLRMVK